MTRIALVTLLVCLMATVLVMADGAVSRRQQNLQLIRELVAGAIRLAADEDPLSRADLCSLLAGRTVKEIRTAVQDRRMDRAVQLGDHLNSMLSLGIANNLRQVRLESSQSSTREIDVERVAAQVRDLLEPLDELLEDRSIDAIELRHTLRKVRESQLEVERIFKSSTDPKR